MRSPHSIIWLPATDLIVLTSSHIDEYVHEGKQQGERDSRRHKEVRRGVLQCSSWDGTVFNWLGIELDIDVALKAAETLFAAVSEAVKQFTKSSAQP